MLTLRRARQDVDFLYVQMGDKVYFWPVSKQSEAAMAEVMAGVETFMHGGYVTSKESGLELYNALHHHPSGSCTCAYVMDRFGNTSIETFEK